MFHRSRQLTAALAVLSLVIGACGTGAPATTRPAASATPAPATPAPATPAPATPVPATPAPTSAPPSETSAPPSETSAPPAETTPPASEEPTPSPEPTPQFVQPSDVPAGVPVIRWFCCLGTGDAPELVKVQTEVVNEFNATHDDVKLALEVNVYAASRDALQTQILAGNAPDIVGPVGVGGANAFHDQWLDLGPLITKNNYDLSQFQQGAVDFYKVGDVQTAIPFAIYPSSMFYQREMFEEQSLAEPPHKYGEKYKMPDGTEVDWTYDTVKQLALMLTVDANGNKATDAGFDPTKIVQYGFEPQRDILHGWGAYFGAGQFMADDGKTVQIPEAWVAAWKYFYDGIWKDKFIMSGPVFEGDEWSGAGQGYAFCSGKVAMSVNFLWSKYCLGPAAEGQPAAAGDSWDLAAVPTWKDKPSAVLNADTFRIHKDTKNADAAFVVLDYLTGAASKKLLTAYGGMPARPGDQEAFFADISAGFPNLTKPADWDVAKAGVEFADNPSFEAFMPKYNESLDLTNTFLTKWTSTEGLDMDAEIAALKTQLQGIWDQ